MTGKRYQIIFSGKLADGKKPSEALQALCALLGREEQQVRALFGAGYGAVILKDLDNIHAYAMQEQLREAGVICSVQEVESPPVEMLSGSMMAMPPRVDHHPPPRPTPQPRPAAAAPARRRSVAGPLVKLILLAALAAGGWWGYRQWFAPQTPAFAAYARYAEALARGQYQAAAEAASGDAKELAESLATAAAPTSMKIYGREFTVTRPPVSEVAGEIAWIKRERTGEKQKDDGTVVIQAEETVCRIPPGVSSVLCKWPVTFRDEVEVVQDNGVWKVALFREERLTPPQQ